ncbi:MAG: hypothetical protein FJ303_24755 [Planctomycetes bacterium]|nr:hypothetical protein [Planctomycetota bacterium]
MRAIYLNEDLLVSNQFTPLVGGVLTFAGAPVPAGTVLSDRDVCRTSNSFYGGQFGGRVEWQNGIFSLNVAAKIAFGATQQIVVIDGSSTMVTAGGAATTVPGGIFAQTSNIGRYYQSAFAVAPEVGVTLGVALTQHINAKFGYSVLHLSRVVRPGNQIDHSVNETLIPTHQFFNTSASDGRPAFSFRQTDFWAQGISFGLEFVY